MLMQALSLPPLQKRYDVLNPGNHFRRLTPLIELGHKKPSDYRLIIEASSTKVKQCFYYIDEIEGSETKGMLQNVCDKTQDPIEDLYKSKNMPYLIELTERLATTFLKPKNLNYKDTYVAVDILATAGMRKLDIEKQTKIWSEFIKVWEEHQKKKIRERLHWELLHQDSIFEEGDSIWELLQLNSIQDTSGVEEGIYGCMVANMALGNLDLKLNSEGINRDNVASSMVGIVEIGGASAQIAVPTVGQEAKKINFNNFKDFYSRSIPFGKKLFLKEFYTSIPTGKASFVGNEIPVSCRFQTNADFDVCHSSVLEKIKELVDLKSVSLPKEICGFTHYYLLGGFFENAWEVPEASNGIASIDDLKTWTITECGGDKGTGAPWPPTEGSFAEMACYHAVYAYSFLEHFFAGETKFYVGKPFLLNKYFVNKDFVDWPSAAYLYLNSHSLNRPSTEVSVTTIKDQMYESVLEAAESPTQ